MKFLTLLCLLFSGPALAKMPGKIQVNILKKLEEGKKADVLVLLEERANLTPAWLESDRVQRLTYVFEQLIADANSAQADLIAYLQANQISFQAFYITNAIAINGLSAEQIEKISTFPRVKKIISNAAVLMQKPEPFIAEINKTKEADTFQDTILAIEANRVWNELNVRGAGIVIGGQDSGYAWRHPAIRRQYRGANGPNINHNYNWHDSIRQKLSTEATTNRCGYNSPVPCDDGDHGTHTMGSMLGDDGGANRIGVAPDAKWMGCRNMDEGYGRPATYLECFEFFLAPYPMGGDSRKDGRPEYAPHVINNSWGCPASEGCQGDEFHAAISNLHAAGVMVVVSAGNDGPACATVGDAPAHYSGLVFSIAAFDQRNNRIASFSSRGPSTWNNGIGVDISAPGVQVRSAIPGADEGAGNYRFMSGTSMAGPHVAGAVALLWSGRPEFIGKISETMTRLQRTAVPKTSTQNCGNFPGDKIPNAVFGYGLLNTYRALMNETL